MNPPANSRKADRRRALLSHKLTRAYTLKHTRQTARNTPKTVVKPRQGRQITRGDDTPPGTGTADVTSLRRHTLGNWASWSHRWAELLLVMIAQIQLNFKLVYNILL